MNSTLSREKAALEPMMHADTQEMTSVRAYFLAQSAGFAPGRELEFWLQAESETLQVLQMQVAPKPKRAPRKKAAPAGVEATQEVEVPKKATRRKAKAE
jgi:hypothetical protein